MVDLEAAGRRLANNPPVAPTPLQAVARRAARHRRRRNATRIIVAGGIPAVVAAAVLAFLLPGSRPAPTSTVSAGPRPPVASITTSTLPAPNSQAPCDSGFSFVDPSRGWVLSGACGPAASAEVLATTDGGRSWSRLASLPYPEAGVAPGQAEYQGIYFADAQDGYAFGPSLAVTHDGGRHWTPSPLLDVTEVTGGDGVVYAVVVHPNQPTSAALWRSPAGAGQWVQVPLPPGQSTSEDYPPFQLNVEGALLVLLRSGFNGPDPNGARGEIWTSGDGGSQWKGIKTPCRLAQDGGAAVMSVALGRPDAWLVDCFDNMQSSQEQVTQHHLYGTSDAGSHWVRLSDPSTTGYPYVLADNGHGTALLLTRTPGALLHASFDGGQSWQVPLGGLGDGPFASLSSLVLVNGSVGFVESPDGRLFRTDDGGHSWSAIQLTR